MSTPRTLALLRIPLDSPQASSRVVNGEHFYVFEPISSTDDGSQVAGVCLIKGGTAACVLNTKSGAIFYLPDQTSSQFHHVAISGDGSRIAYSSYADNPYGHSETYVFDRRTGTTTTVSQLDGDNDQPAWAPGSNTCLAFHHYETTAEDVYIACQEGARWIDIGTKIPGRMPFWLAKS